MQNTGLVSFLIFKISLSSDVFVTQHVRRAKISISNFGGILHPSTRARKQKKL
jgi:hypothetical protein